MESHRKPICVRTGNGYLDRIQTFTTTSSLTPIGTYSVIFPYSSSIQLRSRSPNACMQLGRVGQIRCNDGYSKRDGSATCGDQRLITIENSRWQHSHNLTNNQPTSKKR